MALFEVPGWSLKIAPQREETQTVSKKRKRPSSHKPQLESVEVNLERLMGKLANIEAETSSAAKQPSNKAILKDKKRKSKESPTEQRDEAPKAVPATPSTDMASKKRLKSSPEGKERDDGHTLKSKKRSKTQHVAEQPLGEASSSKITAGPTKAQTTSGLTALQKSMKDSLDGARFRLINENLYKTDSHEAHKMMQEDPKVFEEYHTGFRHQVVSWPTNPVEHYVSVFASYPLKTIIADLGCGDAALAKGLLSKGLAVLSFDLVSDHKYVVEADVCDRIPLPGSEGSGKEKSPGEGQVVDVVVCALSLMGVNWLNCLREAWRILRPGGELHIAEVTSRFTDIEQFQNLLGSIGFRLKKKDETKSTHFILFEFIKVSRFEKTEKEWAKLVSKGGILKPCEYKRR